MARAYCAVSRLPDKYCSGLGCRRPRRAQDFPFAGCARRYLFLGAHAATVRVARFLALDAMSCGHDLSCARPACEPRPACASSASHAGGFAVGASTDRASYSAASSTSAPACSSTAPEVADTLETERPRAVEFPVDIFGCADAMAASGDVRIVAFHALLPAVNRIAVHAVQRPEPAAPAFVGQRECYGVYLLDCDGGEHHFLDFKSAGSATYAAMRIAQVYRLPVEFGTFAEPKARDE